MQFSVKQVLSAALISAALIAAPSFAAGGAPNGSHAKLSCQTCHKDGKFAAPSQKTCLQCHQSYEALAKKTAGGKFNPHDSHMGRVECTQCHGMHKKSHFICHDCHAIKDRSFKGE